MNHFLIRSYIDGIKGGNFGLIDGLEERKASSFYGFEYLNKYSGIKI